MSLFRAALPRLARACVRPYTPTCATAARMYGAAAAAAVKPDVALISRLRKETGLPMGTCKEAAAACSNDYDRAFAWLSEQQAKLGNIKLVKLSSRATAEGAVGVRIDGTRAVIVEMNCETDFVGRNQVFQDLLSSTLDAAVALAPSGGNLAPQKVDLEALKSAVARDGKSVATLTAESVSKLGENVVLGRALAYSGTADTRFGSYVHGMGRFAGLVALRTTPPVTDAAKLEALDEFARRLAQHVVGMSPVALLPSNDVPAEKALLKQDFVPQPERTVEQVVKSVGDSIGASVEIVTFARVARGESD